MELLTIEEAAQYLRVCPETVKRYIRKGDLRATKLSPQVLRIRRDDLDKFIESHFVGGRI